MIKSLFAVTCAIAFFAMPVKASDSEANCRVGTQLALRVVVFMQGINPWQLSPSARLVVYRQAYESTVLAKLLIDSCPAPKAQRLEAGLDMAWLEWNTRLDR